MYRERIPIGLSEEARKSYLHSSEPEGQRLPLIRRSISRRKRYGSWR